MSGGSPASRERAMRSCTMLKASTITVEMPGPLSLRPKNWRCSSFFTARPLRAMTPDRLAARAGLGVRHGGLQVGHDRAAAADVGVEIDGDDVARAERAAHRYRDGIDQRAVEQPAAVDLHRAEDAGQRIGGAHGVDEAAARQPDLVAGADLGGDGDEALDQVLDVERRSSCSLEDVAQALAVDEAGAGEIEVEVAEAPCGGSARGRNAPARRAGRPT